MENDEHAWAVDVVPAQIELFYGVQIFGAFTEAFEAIVAYFTVAKAQDLKLVQSLSYLREMLANIHVKEVFW